MSMFNKVVKEFQWGQHKVRLETGEVARQASGAVIVDVEDTVVLATVVGAKSAKPGQDFFPLTVDYLEKTYSAGKIPGGFFRREGRPSEHETLTSRLIDRPLRPLFPEGFYNEVQVVIHVLSVNPEIPADIPALIGASAALAVSGLPFNGPVGAARVAYIDNAYVLNPTRDQIKASSLDLVVAGTERAVLMVESEADQLSEEVMLGAVVFGHEQMQVAIDAIHELVREGGKPEWDWQPAPKNEALIARVTELAQNDLLAAYQLRDKQARSTKLKEVYAATSAKLEEDALAAGTAAADKATVGNVLFDIEAKIVRSQILNGEPRIDGRDTRTVRPIEIRTGVLPRTHGSALFTRGETQALVVATLGTKGDEQIIDALEGEYRERFMLHYNMPPFATGETGRVGSPKRREIGHGRLAKRALVKCLPSADEFGYSIRVVSEITESNGSSSMASVCGGCLALMDAGVPMKAHVAGIAMGLILEGNKFAVLTDILGDEDHLGDMDFKVAGTEQGVTALQMDIKIQHHEGNHAGRSRRRRPHAHPRQDDVGGFGCEHATVGIRAAHDHDQDQPGKDPRRDRQGRFGDPRADGRNRHDHRHLRRRRRDDREHEQRRHGRSEEAHRADHGRDRSRSGVRRHGSEAARFRRDREPAAGQGWSAAHLGNRQRAREGHQRLPEGRPASEGQGHPDGRKGSRAFVGEGAAERSSGSVAVGHAAAAVSG